jgi:hypothetical protein
VNLALVGRVRHDLLGQTHMSRMSTLKIVERGSPLLEPVDCDSPRSEVSEVRELGGQTQPGTCRSRFDSGSTKHRRPCRGPDVDCEPSGPLCWSRRRTILLLARSTTNSPADLAYLYYVRDEVSGVTDQREWVDWVNPLAVRVAPSLFAAGEPDEQHVNDLVRAVKTGQREFRPGRGRRIFLRRS